MALVLLHIQLRAGLRLVCLLALAIYLIIPTRASAERPIMEVLQVGWDGHVVPGAWSPVRVRLAGGDSDLTGRLEVVSKVRYQTAPKGTAIDYAVGAYGQDVALPAGVPKEVTLWVPSNADMGGSAGSPASVRLVADGRIIAEQGVEFRSANTPLWPLVGVLAESPAVARALSQVELPVQGLPVPLSVARLAAADLPPSAERLSAISALVVQGSAAATLTGAQREALRQWVAAGGHLLLSGGPDAPRAAAALPSGTLPVAFSGADGSTDLSTLARWAEFKGTTLAPGPAARFQAERGSAVAGSPDLPLAWRIGLGQGTVTILAADPGLEPLVGWAGTPALLRKALDPALRSAGGVDKFQYVQMQQRDPSNLLRGAVEALPREAMPGWRDVALLLGGFLVVVGPLLHLVLRRADKRMWSWVAVPALATLLAGGMYYVGVGRDGRDVLVNVVSHVWLDQVGGPARQEVMAGFYAPTHSSLTVDVPGDVPVRPTTSSSFGYSPYGNPAAASSSEPPFHVVTGRDTKVEFSSGQWAMRSVSLSRLVENAGKVTANLQLDGGIIKGAIRNETPFFLEDAAVLVGQSAAKLGSLAPGQSAALALDTAPAANPMANRYPISWRLFGQPRGGSSTSGSSAVVMAVPAPAPMAPMPASYYVPQGGMTEQLEVPQDPEVQRRIRLLDPIVNVPRPGPDNKSMPLTFLAFTREPVGGQLPSAGSHPVFYLTLLDEPLRLDLPPGPFRIPPAVTSAELVSQSGGIGGGGNGVLSWIQLQGGSLAYEFRPPIPAKSSVDALIVGTRQIGQSAPLSLGRPTAPPSPGATPGPAEAGLFSIYNWQSAAWEPLPGGVEEARVQPAAPYVGSDGLVKLQVSAGDQAVMFLQPELTVEGRVAP